MHLERLDACFQAERILMRDRYRPAIPLRPTRCRDVRKYFFYENAQKFVSWSKSSRR